MSDYEDKLRAARLAFYEGVAYKKYKLTDDQEDILFFCKEEYLNLPNLTGRFKQQTRKNTL